MVTTIADERIRAKSGEGYDGVVRICVGGYCGTGVLLYDGRALLTAAHLLQEAYGARAHVVFETSAGETAQYASRYTLFPSYDSLSGNNDLALLWLDEAAVVSAERYTLYRSSDELYREFTMVGYGQSGIGDVGGLENTSGHYVRLKATNRFDAEAAVLKEALGPVMGWSPEPKSQLMADFDNGGDSRDAFGLFLGVNDLGTGLLEGLIAKGDSGGPAFIEGRIAGIASYVSHLEVDGISPDSDMVTNSSFGEIAAWQRVSYAQQWIDESIRAGYVDAPHEVQEVKTSVVEGNVGSSFVYFLVTYEGARDSETGLVSVKYRTFDASAKAGEDYIGVDGTLIFYPNEDAVPILVEIIGDMEKEGEEAFGLEVYDPVGGSFLGDAITLVAMRTIRDDDGF